MKIDDALNRIDTGWMIKPNGFRVQFDIYTDNQWNTDCCPDEELVHLKSEVTAWRLAWKLAQTCHPDPDRCKNGDLANIFVVDNQGNRIPSYITGDYTVYHPQKPLKSPERTE